MALVTRTISGAFADLLHFLALFSIIFLGFTVAGFLLFGHQYQAFSSINNSAQFLVLLLLAFDPTIWIQVCDFLSLFYAWATVQLYLCSHGQMEHAAPTLLIFSVFIWSWVFLAFVILVSSRISRHN